MVVQAGLTVLLWNSLQGQIMPPKACSGLMFLIDASLLHCAQHLVSREMAMDWVSAARQLVPNKLPAVRLDERRVIKHAIYESANYGLTGGLARIGMLKSRLNPESVESLRLLLRRLLAPKTASYE